LPEHCRSPGAHTPWHDDATPVAGKHVLWSHETAPPHAPFDAQVCRPLPAHFVWPGAQSPLHAPALALHVWLTHATALPHVPVFALHVRTPLPSHFVCPGAQTPTHDVESPPSLVGPLSLDASASPFAPPSVDAPPPSLVEAPPSPVGAPPSGIEVEIHV
jgi:hypothetical protein